MKRIYIIAALILSVGLFTSCKEYLNVKPSNVQNVNSFSDVKALMGAHLRMYNMGGVEGTLRNTNVFFFNNNDYLITHLYSDDYDVNSALSAGTWYPVSNVLKKSIDWKNPDISEKIWSTHYQNIGFYNMIIQEAEDHPDVDEENTQRVIAEAKVLRAWQLFRLLQFFSPYHNDKMGLPLNTEPEKVGTYDRARKTQTENYRLITGDLEEVLTYSAKPSPTYNIFYDKNIVHALLAEVYLYKGDSGAKEPDDYQKAVEHAKAAMKGRLEEGIGVYNRAAGYNTPFGMTKDNHYSLISFVYMDNVGNMLKSIIGIPKWGMNLDASEELYNMFKKSGNKTDKRFYKYFASRSRAVSKFDPGMNQFYYKWDFFTAAEMQLIIAEGYARMGQDKEAEEALNLFVKNRYMNYSLPEGETVLQAILDERRKEFCFEYCMRWLDLTRLQTGWTRVVKSNHGSGSGYGDETAGENQNTEYVLENGDYRFCMPLPKKAELQFNKIEQNPGWNNF